MFLGNALKNISRMVGKNIINDGSVGINSWWEIEFFTLISLFSMFHIFSRNVQKSPLIILKIITECAVVSEVKVC